jgi:signal transduction histidine kinase
MRGVGCCHAWPSCYTHTMRRDRQLIDASGRTLLIAFGVVATAFVLSTAIAERDEVGIRRAAQLIAGNSAPSIEHLALLRADLRRLTLLGEGDLDAALEGQGRFNWKPIADAVAALERHWATYRGLPAFAGEAPLVESARVAEQELGRAVARIESLDQAGDRAGVRLALSAELQPAANRFDVAVMRLIDFNAARGAELADKISRLGRQSEVDAIVLDGVCLMLTVLTGFLAWRLVRRYTGLLERRAEELEAFAGRVAHDVIGPLSATSLSLDVLSRGPPTPERAWRAVETGRAGLRRARLIADGLLSFARAGARPDRGARADVAEVITGAINEISSGATDAGFAIISEIDARVVAACNPGVLASLVSNLLRNAVKYAGGGTSPRITVRARSIDGHLGRGWVRIEVEDNGPGLPADLGNHVFDPYVRGSNSTQPGIGLGLATVKRIAVAHGGRVLVRSKPSAGCVFVVELPRNGAVEPLRVAALT